MRTIKFYNDLAENYFNGNFSDFRKGLKHMSKKEMLVFETIFSEYFPESKDVREEANNTIFKYLDQKGNKMKDVQFMTGKEKEIVLKQWKTFVTNGFQFKHFTSRLYLHLINHCSFIAHYSRAGFYNTYFKNPDDTIHFLSQFDFDLGCRSVEYGGTHWLTAEDYCDINRAMCDFHTSRVMVKE